MAETTIEAGPKKSSAAAQSILKQQIAEGYVSYLLKNGFKAEVDLQKDVTFITEGQTFFILIDPNDMMYFRIALPSFWKAESKDKLDSVLPLLYQVSLDVKGVKVIPRNSSVWAYCEMFLPKPDDYQQIFQRMIRALQYAARIFTDKVSASKSVAE